MNVWSVNVERVMNRCISDVCMYIDGDGYMNDVCIHKR